MSEPVTDAPSAPRVAATVHVPLELAQRSAVESVPRIRVLLADLRHDAVRLLPFLLVALMLPDSVTSRARDAALIGAAAACAALTALLSARDRRLQARRLAQAYVYEAEADDTGVSLSWSRTTVPWGDYVSCAVVDGALRIRHRGGGVSYVPITPETAALVAFSRERIPVDGVSGTTPGA